jgi:MerR family copper efflux transcriptional regulator
MRIGEAAAAAGMTAKTLRFYEERGLLPATERSPNGYRSYGEETVTRLQFIRRGQAAGLTLTQIRDILRLRDAGTAPCGHVRELLRKELEDLDRQLAELVSLRETVADFHRNLEDADPAACEADRICSFL